MLARALKLGEYCGDFWELGRETPRRGIRRGRTLKCAGGGVGALVVWVPRTCVLGYENVALTGWTVR